MKRNPIYIVFVVAVPVFAGNTVEANVIITDSASTPETTNSVESATLTITHHTSIISIPPGIQYYLPITLTNYQGTAVTANTQIAIGTEFIGGNALSVANTIGTGFNALAYQQYEACNLQNVEFFFANGTVINSWPEGRMMATDSLSTIGRLQMLTRN